MTDEYLTHSIQLINFQKLVLGSKLTNYKLFFVKIFLVNLKQISKPFELLVVEVVLDCFELDFEQFLFDHFGEVAVAHVVRPIIAMAFDQNF